MKTNKEIKEYLKPYTKMDGHYTKKLVMIQKVRGKITDHLCVWFDIKGSWIGIEGINTKHITLKNHLINNGFVYNEYENLYQRPYSKSIRVRMWDELFYDNSSIYNREYLIIR